MKPNKWLPLSELDFTPQYDRYVCDTRDFHVSAWEREDSSHDTIDEYIDEWMEKNVYVKCIIKPIEILNLIEDIRNWKIKHETILFKVEQNAFKGWLKYIRFKKISESKYIIYTTVGSMYYPIDWRNIINDAKV